MIIGFEDAMMGNWKEQMASVVGAIENRVAHVLREGRTPECLIAHSLTIGEIINYSAGPEAEAGLDWREPITFDINSNGKVIKLRLFRTPDLKRGQIVIP